MVPTLSPQEQRRGTRRVYLIWSAIGLLCVAAILVWGLVLVPRGEGGVTARQNTGKQTGPTGALANQGSGESIAAKNKAVMPQSTSGTGQNSNGEAHQIDQTAAPLHLTDQQRQQIHAYFARNNADRVDSADFALSIGAAVPKKVPLQVLPPEVASAMQGFRNDQYVMVGNQLVIVEPNARRVVAVVPDAG
jgi:hypothetical protein